MTIPSLPKTLESGIFKIGSADFVFKYDKWSFLAHVSTAWIIIAKNFSFRLNFLRISVLDTGLLRSALFILSAVNF